MNKLPLLFLSLFMILSIFSGCKEGKKSAAAADDNLAGKIVFFTNRTDKADTTLRVLADEFEALHPGATVEIQYDSQDWTATVTARAAAEELPDVCPQAPEWTLDVMADYFIPINDLFSRDEIYFYDNKVVDGNLYGIAQAISMPGVIYNKNAFEKAGITETPGTMEEFYEVCKKLKNAGIIPFASNFADGWPLEQLFWSGPRQMISGDVNAENNAVNTPFISKGDGVYEYLEFYRTMYKKGYLENDLISTNWDSFKVAHAKGEVAMTILGSWYPPQVVELGLAPDKLGMFPVPLYNSLLLSPDIFLGVPKTSKYPKTAKAFLKYIFENNRFSKATGYIPPMIGVSVDVPGVDELLSSNKQVLETIPHTMDYDKTWRKAKIKILEMAQEYIIAENPEKVIEKYNAKWEKGKETL